MFAEKRPIPGFDKYTINTNGVVINITTGAVVHPTVTHNKRERVVLINNKFKEVYVPIARTVLRTFNPLPTNDDYKYASVKFLNGNEKDPRLENLVWDHTGYVPYYIPDENISDIQFVPIPNFSQYEINACGIVRVAKTGKLVHVVKVERNYQRVAIWSDVFGKIVTIGIHRLVALTFFVHPWDTDHLVVNHKDGKPWNNHWKNLEWSTYSENSLHAYRTGLRDEAMAVSIKSVKTGEIIEFPSMGEAATFFGCNPGAIFHHLYMKAEPWPWCGYYLKFTEDPAPWPTAESITRRPMSEEYPVVIKNIETGELLHFESYTAAGRHFKMSGNAVKFQANKPKAIPWKGYYVRHDTVDVEWPVYTEKELYILSLSVSGGSPVRITDKNTGEKKDYVSLDAFCREQHFWVANVRRIVKVSDGWYRNYHVEFLGRPTVDQKPQAA